MTVGYPVITISRQYGSGGREIEAQLAERLGIPFYDKTLCAEAAKHSRLDADFLEQAETVSYTHLTLPTIRLV